MAEYLAHTPSKTGRTDTVKDHLEAVANRAAEYAASFGASEEASLAGLLHDIGKYGSLFQRRLEGKESGIDHWSAGAWQALKEYKEKGIASSLVIQGHHIGLQQASKDSFLKLDPKILSSQHPLNLRLSESDYAALITSIGDDGLKLPSQNDISTSLYEWNNGFYVSGMLDVRMLFSALVDADFIETEAHFDAIDDKNKGYRLEGPSLEPEKALDVLEAHLEALSKGSKASQKVNSLRSDLLKACLEAGSWQQGLFTLTAPTGAGKTLSMLAFALKHAEEHGLRRIVVVIPYLSIIEQTAKVYREVFSKVNEDFGEAYILEDHSLAGTHEDDKNREEKSNDFDTDQQRLLAQNWDAPIIVTTSVQFLESLFANRPSACRKLHRLAKSVILFDEVQTLPTGIAVPTLASLSGLAERYNTSIVFSTATQPAFTHLNETVKKFCACGWEPREIVPDDLDLFKRARRTKVRWPDLEQRTSWEELAERLSQKSLSQVLCVVNLKRHALALFQNLIELGCKGEGLFHLSTNMCPAHRKVVLDEVRLRLEQGKPCKLISTQCVEAGVDVDFPVVFRAWGPLDSIAQAAGRCNRNGRTDFGTVHVFLPDEEDYPDGSYRQAAGITRILKAQDRIDIHDPQSFLKYYRELYDLVKPENRKEDLINAIKRQDFVETAKLFRVIEKEAVNVLVPYMVDVFEQLEEEVRSKGLTRSWISRARPYTIGLYKPKPNDPIREWLIPIKSNYKTSDDWFIYLNKEHYNPKTGLVPTALDCLIA